MASEQIVATVDSTMGQHNAEIASAVRSGGFVLGALAIVLGGWTALAPLSGAVVANGFVRVDTNRKTVQHQEGGIVKEVLVRDGDKVAEGQVLLVLDDVRVDATLELLRSQLDSERARNGRLTSERALEPSIHFPADLMVRETESRVRELVEREKNLFAARRDALNSQIALLKAQAGQASAEAAAWNEQIAAETRALALQQDELKANEELVRQNFVQRTRVLTLERAVADYQSRLGEHRAELARAGQKATDIELRIIGLRNAYSQSASDELKDSTNKLFDLEERLRPSRDAAQRQAIVAPVAGEVVDLRVTSIGAVIGPRDPLLDIVPTDSKLIIDTRIRPEDVNHVLVGADVDLRLTAFKRRTTPTVAGKVTYVSADRLVDRGSGATYYEVHVAADASSLNAAGNLQLRAGMPVEVFINTDARTPFQYLLDPIAGYAQRAFREP